MFYCHEIAGHHHHKFPKLGFLNPATWNGDGSETGSAVFSEVEVESDSSSLEFPKLGFLHPVTGNAGGSGSGAVGFGISAGGVGTNEEESKQSGSSVNLFAGFLFGGNGFLNH